MGKLSCKVLPNEIKENRFAAVERNMLNACNSGPGKRRKRHLSQQTETSNNISFIRNNNKQPVSTSANRDPDLFSWNFKELSGMVLDDTSQVKKHVT